MSSTLFARRNADGNFAILDTEGMPVTRLPGGEYPSVYPVGSDLSADYEHAEGIVLDEAGVHLVEIDFEDGYRIDTEAASFTYASATTEDEALDLFAKEAGYADYATLAREIGMSVEAAKADLVITRT